MSTPIHNPQADASHAEAAADIPADCTDIAIGSVIVLVLALFLAAIGWGAATLLGSFAP
jgi:hypothetical protein